MDVKLAKNTSLDRLHPVKSRVTNLGGGGAPGDQNHDIRLTFSGPSLQRGYRRYVTITKPRCTRQSIYMFYHLFRGTPASLVHLDQQEGRGFLEHRDRKDILDQPEIL